MYHALKPPSDNTACMHVLTIDTAITDSGANDNFLTPITHCVNITRTNHGISIHSPNGEQTQASHTAQLNLKHLPVKSEPRSIAAHIIPALISWYPIVRSSIQDTPTY